jgi:hypothetical protein
VLHSGQAAVAEVTAGAGQRQKRFSSLSGNDAESDAPAVAGLPMLVSAFGESKNDLIDVPCDESVTTNSSEK